MRRSLVLIGFSGVLSAIAGCSGESEKRAECELDMDCGAVKACEGGACVMPDDGTGGSPDGTGGSPDGTGGSPDGTGGSPDGTCSDCMGTACESEWAACLENTACVEFMTCIGGCAADACFIECEETYPEGLADGTAIVDCSVDKCSEICGGGDGSGGSGGEGGTTGGEVVLRGTGGTETGTGGEVVLRGTGGTETGGATGGSGTGGASDPTANCPTFVPNQGAYCSADLAMLECGPYPSGETCTCVADDTAGAWDCATATSSAASD